MNKIILLSYADLSINSGNVTLISRRGEAIYKKFGILTECVMVSKSNRTINHNYNGVSFKIIRNRFLLKKYLFIEKPIIIILYGAKSFLLFNLVKKIKKYLGQLEIFTDIQGAFEERIEYNVTIWKKLLYYLEKTLFVHIMRYCDGVFVVSEELEKYIRNLLPGNSSKLKYIKINCGISNRISIAEKIRWRTEIRNSWGINDNQIVFTFSGFRMPWQKIADIINLFIQIDKEKNNVFFAFYCNIDDEFLNLLKNKFPKKNYVAKFLDKNEYFRYLSACDVGVILRDYNVTNLVAFPNKFSDYIAAGLVVSINKAIPSIYNLVSNNNLLYLDSENFENIPFNLLIERNKHLEAFYKYNDQFINETLLYEKQITREFAKNPVNGMRINEEIISN